MSPEKAFQLYFAVRLHFTSSYNVFVSGTNFNGKYDVSSRKDFGLIIPIMKCINTERELIEFCVANYLYGNSNFLYDPEWADANYNHWLMVKQSLTYTLEKDLSTIELYMMAKSCTLEEYLRNQVISDLLSQRVEYESLMLLDRKTPIIDKIHGFDALKYITRMSKASMFVNKGTLDLRHLSHIDNFLATVTKEITNGNHSIAHRG